MRANLPIGSNHFNLTAATVAFALSQNLSLSDIQAATGFDPQTFGNPNARFDDRIPNLIWVALMERADPDVALVIEAARAAPFTALCGIAEGAQFAPTLKDALKFLTENDLHIADRLESSFYEEAGEARLVAFHPNDLIDRGRTVEVGAALICRVIREMFGISDPLIRVEFPFEAMGPVDDYQAFFRCPVHFDQQRTALVFDAGVLDYPLKSAEPSLFHFVEQNFAATTEKLNEFRGDKQLIRLSEAVGSAALCGDFRIDSVLSHANMSRRTAQRVAAANKTTLQEMIQEARRSTAETLLDDGKASVETIASLVGFSDDRAFRRAFKRWNGFSPSEFRRRAMKQPKAWHEGV